MLATKLINAVLMITALMLLSCAKEKEPEFPAGEGRDLIEIGSFDSKEFSLTAGEPIANGNRNVTDADTHKIAELKDINNFPLTEYETNSDLMKDVLFRGKPGATYKIKYVLDDIYLKVLKVAPRELIPLQEQTYASVEKDETGKEILSVPLVGYKVNYFMVERRTNSVGEETHLLRETAVQDKSKASHFKVDFNRRIAFDAVAKQNIFPARYFGKTDDSEEVQWFYADTVIAASSSNNHLIGGNEDFSLEKASRIRFRHTKNSIDAIDMNLEKALADNDHNYTVIFSLPVERYDFRVKTIGDTGTLEEEKIGPDHKDVKAWKNNQYVKIDFENIVNTHYGKNKTVTTRLKNLEISADYFSFTLLFVEKGTEVKYSMRKAHEPVKNPRKYFKSDRRKFGYFKSVKDFIKDITIERESDYEKNTFINRFYPENGVIFFHLTHNSPPRYEHLAQEMIDRWNDAFAKAYAPKPPAISVQLAKEKYTVIDDKGEEVELERYHRVPLGDIRYNVINLIEDPAGGNLFGFGPSTVDSLSGEILSASANIHLNPMRESHYSIIRSYIRDQVGAYKPHLIDFSEFNIPMVSGVVSDDVKADEIVPVVPGLGIFAPLSLRGDIYGHVTGQILSKKNKLLHDNGLNMSRDRRERLNRHLEILNADKAMDLRLGMKEKKKDSKVVKNILTSFDNEYRHYGTCANFGAHYTEYTKKIEVNCPFLSDYIEEINEVNADFSRKDSEERVYHIEGKEKDTLMKCAEILMRESIMDTGMHEIGHTLGLRHNFMGNIDYANWVESIKKDDKGRETTIGTSSIMEYLPDQRRMSLEIKPYDIAALRFGYAGQVQMDNNELLDLDVTLSIKDNIAQAFDAGKVSSKKRKPYMYCTDEDVGIESPLCRRHDSGRNPREIVEGLIRQFNLTFASYVSKYNRVRPMSGFQLAAMLERQIFMPMSLLYEKWRQELTKIVSGPSKYLHDLSEEDLNYKISKIREDKSKVNLNRMLDEYQYAADLIVKFYEKIAFLPDRSCVINHDGAMKLYSFARLQKEIYDQSDDNYTIKNCFDNRVAEVRKDFVVADEIGYHLSNYKKDLNSLVSDYWDITGISELRFVAFFYLVAPNNRLLKSRIDGFKPNIMNNEKYMMRIGSRLYNRLIGGIDMTKVVFNEPKLKQMQGASIKGRRTPMPAYAPLYSTAQTELLENFMEFFKMGLMVPGKQNETQDRFLYFLPRTIGYAQGKEVSQDRSMLSGQNPLNGQKRSGPAYVFKQDDRTKFIVSNFNSFFSYSLLTSYNAVDRQIMQINTPVEKPMLSLENLMAYNNWTSLPKDEAAFNALTMAEFNKRYNLDNLTKGPEAQFVLKEVLIGNLFQFVMSKEEDKSEDNPIYQMSVGDFIKKNDEQLSQAIGASLSRFKMLFQSTGAKIDEKEFEDSMTSALTEASANSKVKIIAAIFDEIYKISESERERILKNYHEVDRVHLQEQKNLLNNIIEGNRI